MRKESRQSKIRELVAEREIATQEELSLLLQKEGYRVTQATVSRDIRELKLLKQMSDMGTYKYVVPKNNGSENQHVYSRALASSVKTSSDRWIRPPVWLLVRCHATQLGVRVSLLYDTV